MVFSEEKCVRGRCVDNNKKVEEYTPMERDPFSTFVGEMLEAKQLQGIEGDVRKQLEADLKAQLLDQIDRAVVDALPDEKIDELNTLLDQGVDEARIQEFIGESGVDVQRVTLETMLRFRELYIGDTAPAAE